MLTDNILLLKKKFSNVWDIVKSGVEADTHCLKLEATRNNQHTLSVLQDTGWNNLHSKYDPEAEAKRFIDSLEDVEKYKYVFFYGIGIGYHIDVFLHKFPGKKYWLYEPNVSIFKKLLSCRDISELISEDLEQIYTDASPTDQIKNLHHFVSRVKDEVLFVALPSYERIFSEQTKKFTESFREAIFERRKYNYGAVTFAKRAVINGIYNMPANFKTPNILNELPDSFKGKPAILVAAGPSLDYEYENLRYIKENGLAYIFSVGSAINSLIKNNIFPDAACTYDGSKKNASVFEKMKEKAITNVPLLYGTTVGFETIQDYPGPLFHFLVNRDTVNPFFLKRQDREQLGYVNSAESIAIITLQLLNKLGCGPIILVGQNLAYDRERSYANGSVQDVNVTENMKKTAIVVKDVDGNDIYTIKGLDSFRKEMERYISELTDLEVINTTKGGAHIEGTTYIPLEKVIHERLNSKNLVTSDWIGKHTIYYDHEYFRQQENIVVKQCADLERVLKSFSNLFKKMHDAVDMHDKRELEKFFNRFDRTFDELQDNQFYLLFIQMMNYLEFEFVMKTFEEVRFHKDILEKSIRVLEDFSKYLENCRADFTLVKSIFEDVRKEIHELHSTHISGEKI